MWLLEAMATDELGSLHSCLASGMLEAEGSTVGFRHEIARAAVDDALPPDVRVALHRRALAALEAVEGHRPDPALLAHHAEAAGDHAAVIRYARLAGERAAALRAHREAAAQFARALRCAEGRPAAGYAEGLPRGERAALLECCSYECYLTNQLTEAVQARREAVDTRRTLEDRLGVGDGHRWLSRLAWLAGDNDTAQVEGRRAVELLEREPPSRELAMAYSN
jgi:hypothetical protein